MMQVLPIVAPEPMLRRPVGGEALTSAAIWRILHEHIYERFFWMQIPWTDLVADDGQGREKRARYELRYRQFILMENGLLGKEGVTEKHFRYHNVGININAMRQQLMIDQPALDWWIVGLVVEKKEVNKPSLTFRQHVIDSRNVGHRAFGESMPNLDPASYASQDPENTYAVSASPGTVPRVEQVPDMHYVVHLAWADISGNELMDTITSQHERDGAVASTMADYAETKQLRFLTPGAQKNRRKAQTIITQWAADQRVLGGDAPPQLSEPTSAKLPKAGPAPGPSRAERMAAARDRIIELRAKGTPLPAISKSVKLTIEEIRELLAESADGSTP